MLEDPAERVAVARLNWNAGQRAKSLAAFHAALAYFRAGLELLPGDCWETEYELAWNLHREAAECAYLSGHFAEAERDFQGLLERARTDRDRAGIHALRVAQYKNLAQYGAAVECGWQGLALFGCGCRFRRRPSSRRWRASWNVSGRCSTAAPLRACWRFPR